MMHLTFESPPQSGNGRVVRRAHFAQRSAMPVSAACLVANGVRERLAAMLGSPASVRLLEPRMPSPQAWSEIGAGALMLGVRGSAGEAALILREPEALSLAAAAFGERAGIQRELSPVEREIVLRALRGLAPSLCAVCGTDVQAPEPILDISGYATYFEILAERPAPLRLGVALARDPVPRSGATLRIEDLASVEIECAVEFARGSVTAEQLLDLRPGAHVPMMTRVGQPGVLTAGGAALARGECGALGLRAAMVL